jgi:hypothetical protein
MTFTNELKRLKKVLMNAVSHSDSSPNAVVEDQNIDSIIRRLVKYKEDNKKLKNILK